MEIMLTRCSHRVCAKLRAGGACTSLSVILVVPSPNPCVLLVKQNSGQYEGRYTVCSGKRDEEDGDCWVATAIREMREEIKLHVSEKQFMRMCSAGGEVRVIRKGPTPIFIAMLPELVPTKSVETTQCDDAPQDPSITLEDTLVIFRDQLNAAIISDRDNESLPSEYREVDRVDWFGLDLKMCFSSNDEEVIFSTYAKLVVADIARRYGKMLTRPG